MTAWVLANPAAGRGISEPAFDRLAEGFRRIKAEFHRTERPGDERELAARALAAGASSITVVGGDGTCSKVAAVIVRARSDCALCVIPWGTGNDFAKTLGVKGLPLAAITSLIQSGNTTLIDAGFADGHFFLNSCGFGFDPSVLAASNKVQFLRGDAVYIYSAVRQLFTYPGLSVGTDGGSPSRMLMVTVSNGRSLGGAFQIAPAASVTDGKLDITYFADCNVAQRARAFASAFRGSHGQLPTVRTEKRDALTLEFTEGPLMEIDGELHRASTTRVAIECLPRALKVIAAPDARL